MVFDGLPVDIKIPRKDFNNPVDVGTGQLHDKIDITSHPRDGVKIPGDRSGNHVGDGGLIEPSATSFKSSNSSLIAIILPHPYDDHIGFVM